MIWAIKEARGRRLKECGEYVENLARRLFANARNLNLGMCEGSRAVWQAVSTSGRKVGVELQLKTKWRRKSPYMIVDVEDCPAQASELLRQLDAVPDDQLTLLEVKYKTELRPSLERRRDGGDVDEKWAASALGR